MPASGKFTPAISRGKPGSSDSIFLAGILRNKQRFQELAAAGFEGSKTILQQLAHRTAIRLNRRIIRPVLGRFLDGGSYDAIRAGFHPTNVTAGQLTLDATVVTPGMLAQAAAILDWHGVVVLRNFAEATLMDAARREADGLMAPLNEALAGTGNCGRAGNISWQVGGARFKGHRAILAQGRPLANLRSRDRGTVNGGVIDLFFLDKAARENGWRALGTCCLSLQAGPVADIVAAVSSATPRQVNMLRNESVTATRGLHIDNLKGSYKAFLYLGDVGMADGPYAYVPGSHDRRDLLRREARLNSLKGRPETDSYAFAGLEVPLPAQKGTLIRSCQSGVHRGLPQRAGASRTVLVGNYRV
jgi:hypothetical protein